jgi:hypothetical protein
VLLLGALTACSVASGNGADPDTWPDRLTGTWLVDLVELKPSDDAGAVELARTVSEEIDAVVFDQTAASIEATTGCRRIFGSYTFLAADQAESGIATFTIPGLSTDDCPPEDDLAAVSLTALLEQVQSWRQDGDRLMLEGPEGRLGLRPAG